MKCNIKIKNLLFLIFLAIIFSLPAGKVLAATDICVSSTGLEGTCQTWCSDPLVKDEGPGSMFCAEQNYFQNSCCVSASGDNNLTSDSSAKTEDVCIKEGGTCQTWCSSGYNESEIGSAYCANENYFQNTCCIKSTNTSTSPTQAPPSIKWCASIDGKETGKCVVGSTCTAKTINSNDCSGIPGALCCGDSQGASSYQAPSLITCNGGAGLCYGSGCPEGSAKLDDTNKDCGWANSCCGKTAGAGGSCGSGGLCVDSGVICTDVISGTCDSGQKCCSVKVPVAKTETPATETTPKTFESQCDANNQNCKRENDQAILDNQCKVLFNPNECSSMSTYLNSLTDKCLRMKPAGIDCATINSGGFYGNEAKKFADLYIAQNPTNNSGTPGTGTAGQGAGGLNFDEIAALGMPDSPGGIKPILVNIAKWMLEIIGLIALMAFMISGGQYLLATGNDKMIETAKRNMTYSIIGVIVALSGFVIIRAIDAALRASSSLF